MEMVGIKSKQYGNQNYSSPTGHTVSYVDINLSIQYIKGSILSELNNISARTLRRYKADVTKSLPKEEHRLYFHTMDTEVYYSEKILGRRSYKPREQKERYYEEIRQGIQDFTPTLINRLKAHKWNFACAINYPNRLEIYQCEERMNEVANDFQEAFSGRDVTIFYTTEPNDKNEGFHNHLVVSVSGDPLPTTSEVRNTLAKAGTRTPWAEKYIPADNYLEYSSKCIDRAIEGWKIISTSRSVIKGFLRHLPIEPLYVPQNYKKKPNWP